MSQPHEIVQRVYQAFGQGDMAAIVAELAPTVRVQHPQEAKIPWGGTYHGPQGFVDFLTALGTHADVEEFHVEQMLAGGNTVVALGREQVHVKATGRRYQTDWVHVWRVEDGKITSFQDFNDTATIVEAVLG
jgi:ketosteroid isomerase-like protein